MHSQRIISLWALLAILLGQMAFAHHSTEHSNNYFFDNVVVSHAYDDNHNHKDERNHEEHKCPECLLAQTLQAAYYNAPAYVYEPIKVRIAEPFKRFVYVDRVKYKSYAPRAPPTIFI